MRRVPSRAWFTFEVRPSTPSAYKFEVCALPVTIVRGHGHRRVVALYDPATATAARVGHAERFAFDACPLP